MKAGGIGGANTQTGLHFEKEVDFIQVLDKVKGYSVDKTNTIFLKDKPVAISLQKHNLYRFLKENNINYKQYLSKKLLPDEAILNLNTNVLYVIEMKFQKTTGSVDEKLQTCHFKKRQYEKLMKSLNIKIGFIYILNDWFNSPSYEDVLNYIKDVGCDYFFKEISLKRLGLPTS